MNLHIKKRHEAIVPNWTIQGTKGVRVNGVNRVIDYKRFTGTNGDEGKIVQIGK